MTRCWEGPLGAVSPLVAPSWLTAQPRTTARTRWPLRCGVGEPLQHEHADALAPAGAVGAGGEGLAPAVGGEAALPGELDERSPGVDMTVTPPASARSHSPPAQRLRGQVQRDQRGGAGGVHGDRRALEAERVGTRPEATLPALPVPR